MEVGKWKWKKLVKCCHARKTKFAYILQISSKPEVIIDFKKYIFVTQYEVLTKVSFKESFSKVLFLTMILN